MKAYLSGLIIAAAFFSVNETHAQMPMSQMMGGPYGRSGMNPMGMDRSIGANQYSNGKRKGATAEKVDPLEQALNNLEKELTLDSFQVAVVKDLMEKNQTEENKVLKEEIPDEAKIEKFGNLRGKLDNEIKKLLSPEQLDKFAKMKDKFDKRKS